MKKRIRWILAGIIAVFLITNPSIKDFKNFKSFRQKGELISRENYLIFSIYRWNYTYYMIDDYPIDINEKYLGILGQFHWLPLIDFSPEEEVNPEQEKMLQDSIAAMDSMMRAAEEQYEASQRDS